MAAPPRTDYGFPVAPECWDQRDKPWGSLYYNWDGPITDLILKRLAGVQYSIPDQTFTVAEHTPETWGFLEVQVPIAQKGKLNWVQVRVNQKKTKQGVQKNVSVSNNPLKNLVIEPWLADRELRSGGGMTRFVFTDTPDKTIGLKLGKTAVERRTLPEDGVYNFTVRSDDGSRLVIDGRTVVELNVLCARDPWSGDGTIALKKGYHKVRIDYFQAKTHITLQIRASVNGGPHTPVQPDMFFHEEGK